MEIFKTLRKVRRQSYRLSRDLGDVNAISRGPKGVAKRVVRKSAYKAFGRFMNGGLR